MAFKLRSGNTSSFKKMGSSPLLDTNPHTGKDPDHGRGDHTIPETPERIGMTAEELKEAKKEQSLLVDPDKATTLGEQGSDYDTSTAVEQPGSGDKRYGKYSIAFLGEVIDGKYDLSTWTPAQWEKLSGSMGQNRSFDGRIANLLNNRSNMGDEGEEVKKEETKVEKKKITEYYTKSNGVVASRTGYANADGVLPAYEGQENLTHRSDGDH